MSKGTGPLSKIYNAIIGTADKFVPKAAQPLWLSPAGPRTIFFWAPIFKWGLIIAGLGDIINRPAQNISISQCATVATTGMIWSRWSMVIIPKNYNLFAVNIAVFLTQGILVGRALKYRQDHPERVSYQIPQEKLSYLDKVMKR